MELCLAEALWAWPLWLEVAMNPLRMSLTLGLLDDWYAGWMRSAKKMVLLDVLRCQQMTLHFRSQFGSFLLC